jgi:regulator of protease activity HflC (stomatin/prohibitin superfamily)
MANDNVYIYDHETGTEVTREMTDAEQAERNANVEIAQAKRLADQKAISDAEANKALAQAKLEALGLTADDLKALGL